MRNSFITLTLFTFGCIGQPERAPASFQPIIIDEAGVAVAESETLNLMPEMYQRGCYSSLEGKASLQKIIKDMFYSIYMAGKSYASNELETKQNAASELINALYSRNCVIPGVDEMLLRIRLESLFQSVFMEGRHSI